MPEVVDRPSRRRIVVSNGTETIASDEQSRRTSAAKEKRSATDQEAAESEADSRIVHEYKSSRRRRTARRASSSRSGSSTSSRVSTEPQRKRRASSGFFPDLGRILEVAESAKSSRPSPSGSGREIRVEGGTTRRSSHREQATRSYRQSMKSTSNRDRSRSRNEGLPRINPSLLSVLSTATGTSSRSSNSSSTITPASYSRRDRPARYISTRAEKESEMADRSELPNVFDFIEQAEDPKADSDARSTMSSSSVSSSASSQYQASEAGSSVASDTPSSGTTFPPSPAATRNQSVADLRKKIDAQYPANSCQNSFNSPAASTRSLRKQPSVEDVPEVEEAESIAALAPPDISLHRPRSTSRSSRRSSRSSDGRRPRLETVDEYLGSEQEGHYIEPVHGQHRSFSTSSSHSNRSGHGYPMAMQHYQWPTMPPPPPPMLPSSMNGHVAVNDRPLAPEPPDLSLRTITGYEEMALELSSMSSPVKPLYRRFEYLNHRILLHLQDELSELEENLRHMDERIAQCDPKSEDGGKSPASRRVHPDNFYEADIHLRRTHLLGDIFRKTEQYNRAMSAYTTMVKDTAPANDHQILAYQNWMAKHTPIAEMESRFLHHAQDLIAPSQNSSSLDRRATKPAALAYLPVALMLPLLLFSIIPTIAGRLIVTALIAVGAFIVAATTRIRALMEARDWAICGAVYVLLMGAVAGCIPQYH